MIYVLALVLFAGITLIARQKDPRLLRLSGALSMVGVSVYGAGFTDFYVGVSNIGTVFFAGAVYSLTILCVKYGYDYGRDFVRVVFVAALAWNIGMLFVGWLDIQPDEIGRAFSVLLDPQARLLAASFVAFLAGQSVFVYLLKKWEGNGLVFRVFGATCVMQVLDTVIFFPIAFGGSMAAVELVNAAFVSLVVKVALAAVSIHFLRFV